MLGNSSTPTVVRIPLLIWAQLVMGLRKRGEGRRESGAFLLGSGGNIRTIVFYDQVDPNAYQRGAIEFHGEGYVALWAICKKRGLEVLADAHTHPGAGTGQSYIDQRHPMIPEIGHTALILPHFAHLPIWSMRGVGVHEYLGSFKWQRHDQDGMSTRVALTLW